MTRFLPTYLGLLVLMLGVAGFVVQASGKTSQPTRFVVVVDATSGERPSAVAAATSALRAAESTGAEGELRITRTPTEQLDVTHYFAAQGYDAVVGVGLDEAVAVAPVAERYPDTRFALTGAGGVSAAVAAAAR